MATTIVLADDHAVVRSGLKLLLQGEEDFEVVALAGTADDALRYVRGHKPDVLILDLNMPGARKSLDVIPEVEAASPGTRVVVLTMQEDPAFARARGGRLDLGDDELVNAVRLAGEGKTYLHPRLGAALAAAPEGPPDDLTEREVDVLRLIALGHTNSEIAEQLHLSVRTVETHRAHIQQKLRLSARAELVRYALERGLVKVPPSP